jgi:sodium-dependent dicarboxylate transporter 2/3/5
MMTLPACEPVLASAASGTPRTPEAEGIAAGRLPAWWYMLAGGAGAIGLTAAIWLLPQSLSRDGRIALTVLALAVIGWITTRLGDALVGLAAALALAATGVLGTDTLFGMLGHELIWLLVAAFIISAVLRASGLIERVAFAVIRWAGTVRRLFLGLTGVIAATAFVIPSTSGRAALMLPVFLALADRIAGERIVRALALLFPTIILLSAAGSLAGAGAHIVAVEFMARSAHEPIDYIGWMANGLPFALVSSALAGGVILRLFLTAEEASRQLDLGPLRRPRLTRRQLGVASIVLLTMGLWMAVPAHGLSLALTALIGTVALLLPGVAPLSPRDAFKAVDVELLVFLAATLAMAEALARSGADRWLAQGVVEMMPAPVGRSTPLVVAAMALVSLLAHLVITSRTARAAVLIPTLALPVAGLGHDPKLLILVTVMGSGFCQTLTASAKPVAVFANAGRPTFTSADLLRLSGALLPVMLGLLVLFALLVWS